MAQTEQPFKTPCRRLRYRSVFGQRILRYCAGVIAASSLEFKDKNWGGEWDWIDWGLTVLGAALGSVTKLLIR